jgi:glycine oxidase
MSDIVIIGAGAVGCLTALELRRRGANVTLVDRGILGAESSWAGGGILFPLLPWRYREEVNQLALAGARRYAALSDALYQTTGISPEYRVSGMRVLPDYGDKLAHRWCESHNVKAERDGDALWLPEIAQVRNPRLLQALRRQLEIDGVILHEHVEVGSFTTTGYHVNGLKTAGGKDLHADNYILTAGAWSQAVLGKHAANLVVNPMRGQMLLYKMSPGLLEQILYREDFYLIPRIDGHILAGSTVEDVGFDKSTTQEVALELHQKAVALLPALHDQTPVKHWAGLRPGSPDNIPTIGRHPTLENLWLNAGHFRYGVTMAPASAEILADLMA